MWIILISLLERDSNSSYPLNVSCHNASETAAHADKELMVVLYDFTESMRSQISIRRGEFLNVKWCNRGISQCSHIRLRYLWWISIYLMICYIFQFWLCYGCVHEIGICWNRTMQTVARCVPLFWESRGRVSAYVDACLPSWFCLPLENTPCSLGAVTWQRIRVVTRDQEL